MGMPQGRQLHAHNQVFLGGGPNHFVTVQVQLFADLWLERFLGGVELHPRPRNE
jgi:hypothetical protein